MSAVEIQFHAIPANDWSVNAWYQGQLYDDDVIDLHEVREYVDDLTNRAYAIASANYPHLHEPELRNIRDIAFGKIVGDEDEEGEISIRNEDDIHTFLNNYMRDRADYGWD
jgi:Na+-transporting NADH:ubiquinone oxidoreductase subunit NqrF